MARLFRLLVLSVLICGFAVPAHAAKHFCIGSITYLSTGSNGAVWINIGYGTTSVCDLDTPLNGIGVETCAAWYGTFITVLTTGARVEMAFNTAHTPNADMTSCANLGDPGGSWINRQPYNLRIMP